jgi:Protein of unknown function (DUF2786)
VDRRAQGHGVIEANGRDKLRTVRLLLAKAEKAATPEEAEAYVEKAMTLMARHGIDEALLAATGQGPPEGIERRSVGMDEPYSRDKAGLLNAIAEALHCGVVLHTAPGSRGVKAVSVIGHLGSLARVDALYTSLLVQATSRMMRLRPRTTWSGQPIESVSAYRRSWLQGFSHTVFLRLTDVERRAAGETAGGAPGAELALRSRDDEVAAALAEEFPDLAAGRARRLSGSGYAAGCRDGTLADLGASRLETRRRAISGG